MSQSHRQAGSNMGPFVHPHQWRTIGVEADLLQ